LADAFLPGAQIHHKNGIFLKFFKFFLSQNLRKIEPLTTLAGVVVQWSLAGVGGRLYVDLQGDISALFAGCSSARGPVGVWHESTMAQRNRGMLRCSPLVTGRTDVLRAARLSRLAPVPGSDFNEDMGRLKTLLCAVTRPTLQKPASEISKAKTAVDKSRYPAYATPDETKLPATTTETRPMPPAKSIRTWRKSGRPEEFHVETITLRPISLEDPEHALIDVNEAARILGVKQNTIAGHLDRGTFTIVRRSSSTRRWLLRDEVLALAARKGIPSPTGEA
jgi:hypothetical protein